MTLTVGVLLRAIALVIFAVLAFGVTGLGMTEVEEAAAGLAFLTAGLIVP